MESIDAKPSVKACVFIRQSEVSCSFWADWSSTIWLNAGCLPWILFFPHRTHYLDCYAVCRGDFPLGSCLRCGQITQSCTRLFFFRPHKYIFTNTPLSPLRSLPLVFSSQIVCFHAWAEKWEHPLGELALIHLRETGAKAEEACLNAVVSTVPVSKSLALCVLRFTMLWFNNTFTLCVHNDRASFDFTENCSDNNCW